MADKKKKPVKKPPLQVKLQEDASIRLKAFIEDLRHDPMFRHRLFYPVLYKKTVYKQEQSKYKNNKFEGVTAPIAHVIYEYYLFKMEGFYDDDTAKIFQAILLANGPMLPEKYRLYLKDANAQDSLLNRSNIDTVIQRTRIFLDILQDENLYNFIFSSTIEKDLEGMRKKFYELTVRSKKPAEMNIAGERISNEYEQNVAMFRKYFEHIKIKNIRDVVQFLVYMGEPRTVVTDFSYRPMPQDELEKYVDYVSGGSDDDDIVFKVQIEYALNSDILQKDLASQLDTFIPMLLNEYTSFCLSNINSICANSRSGNQIRIPREIENSIKLKLQRSIKRIHDYTYNYISRKLIDNNHNSDLFISKILNKVVQRLKNNEPISDILRNELVFSNFVGSSKNDLADLISTIFKSDLEYIGDLCSDASICQKFNSPQLLNWNPLGGNAAGNAAGGNTDPLEALKKELIDKAIKPLIEYFKINYETEKNNIKKLVDDAINTTEGYEIYKKAVSDAASDHNSIRKNNRITSFISNTINVFKNLFSSHKNDHENAVYYSTLYNMFYVLNMMDLLHSDLKVIENDVKNANELLDIYKAFSELNFIDKTINDVLVKKINENIKTLKDYLQKYSNNISVDLNKKLNEMLSFFENILNILKPISDITKIYTDQKNIQDFLTELDFYIKNIKNVTKNTKANNNANRLLEIYFKYYLRPVLINFFSYAFDNFEYTTRQDDISADVVSKDILHFSKLLNPRNVGILTFDGAVIHDLVKFTYILTSDTFSGVTYNDPDSVIDFLNKVYGLRYFNVVIYGRQDAYVYLNNTGIAFMYRGVKTKIPIRELRNMYDFLMDPSRGLYKNINLPKKRR